MAWQRLNREDSIKVVESVLATGGAAGMFSTTTSEVQKWILPFYETTNLYQVTNFASLPSFSFKYLGNGVHFHQLDGTELPIYTINDRGMLSLNERTVVDYLEFFFQHVMLDGDEMFFIKDPYDMPLLASMDKQSRDSIIRNHTAAEVSYDAGFDKYTVDADLYAEGLLMRATIEVTGTGRVTIQSRKMIVNAIAQSAVSGIMA